MRQILLAAAVVACAPALAEIIIDKPTCTQLAATFERAVAGSREYAEQLSKMKLGPLRTRTSEVDAAAVDKVVAAQAEAVEKIRAFTNAMEDVSYRLRVCGRQ